jgi:hypothetical protein
VSETLTRAFVALGGTLAASRLSDDRFTSGTAIDGVQAGTLGLQLPFFGVVLFRSVLIALHATATVV